MRMTSDERARYARDGYLLRPSAYAAHEIETLRSAVEDVAARVSVHARRAGGGPEIRLADGHRLQFSSRAGIQWEWAEGSQSIRLIEPAMRPFIPRRSRSCPEGGPSGPAKTLQRDGQRA